MKIISNTQNILITMVNLIDQKSKMIEYLGSKIYHWKDDGKFKQ